jgi:hypothetical protein
VITSRDELLKKYNIPVPRYTSYPTVPYWSDIPTTAEWLDSLNRAFQKDNPKVSIYVHLPYCETLCTFCGCNTAITKNHAVEEPYIKALQKEIELYLGKEISPIKFINFDSGYSSDFWKNNVICLGLSSSFVEPLEATSIHNTIVQISIFVDQFLDISPEITFIKTKQMLYNKRIKFLMDLTVDFISLHYQGGKRDSEFWRHIADDKVITDNASIILEQAKYKIPGYTIMEGMYGSFSIPLVNWNLAGMGIITKDQAKLELEKESKTLYAKKMYEDWVLECYS